MAAGRARGISRRPAALPGGAADHAGLQLGRHSDFADRLAASRAWLLEFTLLRRERRAILLLAPCAGCGPARPRSSRRSAAADRDRPPLAAAGSAFRMLRGAA